MFIFVLHFGISISFDTFYIILRNLRLFLFRKFHLDLYPSDSVFAHDHKSRQSDGKESHVDTSFIYDGKIRGEFLKVILYS